MLDDRATAPALMPPLQPGATLGRYQLLCIVAQGGMGAVWAARMRADHGFERKVAVKTILPQFAEERRFREMFLDEARLASRIIHANVVQVLDLAEQDGILFQAMEWVEGDSLRALVSRLDAQNEAFAWPVAVRIVLEISKGLHAAHELCDDQGAPLHVVHRDVSPHNIMLGLDGSVRITDFGIAKAQDRLSPDTSKGNIKGKLRYMAPEQAVGKPIDRRADVWSLGAILYELLTGRPLFDAPNDAALLYELVSTPPTLLFEKPIHPRLLALLRRALSRSPEGRHPTAEVFGNDLRRAAKEAGLETSTDNLAGFFQTHLGPRCEARRKLIEQSGSGSAPIASPGFEVEEPNALGASLQLAGAPLDSSLHVGTLSSFARSVESGRRRSLIAGSLLLGCLAIATGWLLYAPRERPAAGRYLDFQLPSLPVTHPPASSAALPGSAAAVTPPASTSASAAVPSHTAKRAPRTGARPRFDEVDDGF